MVQIWHTVCFIAAINANQQNYYKPLKSFIMKNTVFTLVTFVLVSLGTLKANNTSTINQYNNGYGNSFTFVESGITFSVFQNGEFDFYINRRNVVNANYHNNNINISFNSGYNYDAYVQYDRYGAVIQIENVPVYYDYYGRVTQVGNININYNNNRLVSLGGMRIYYNNYGTYAYYRGYINAYNRYYVYHPYHNYFVQPYYDYSVVSYKPYRQHYKEQRYSYHHDHSKNKYYKHNNEHYKNNSYNKSSQRVATHSVPEKRNEQIVRNDRKSGYIQSSGSTNENNNYTAKRNISTTGNTRTETYEKNKTTIANNKTQVRNVQNSRTVEDSRNATKRNSSTAVNKQNPIAVDESKRTLITTNNRSQNIDSNKSNVQRRSIQ